MLISSGSYRVEVLTIVSLSHFPVDDVDTNILPFNSQIKFVLLLTVNHTILMMLVLRI